MTTLILQSINNMDKIEFNINLKYSLYSCEKLVNWLEEHKRHHIIVTEEK